jgi:predicted double-glycine peptidase
VVKQRFDYSCGSAALATLLTYGLNAPVDELTLLRGLPQGFRLHASQLAKLSRPVIVFIKPGATRTSRC